MYGSGTIIESGIDYIYIADDWIPKHTMLSKYDRMDIFVDTSIYDSLSRNVERMLTKDSWQRNLLCDSLSAEEYKKVCAKPTNDPSFQSDHQAALKRLVERCRSTAAQLKLNESQQEALILSLQNRFVLLQGPPGTGKTKIAVAMCIVHRGMHNTVVTAATHKAVDHLLKQLMEQTDCFTDQKCNYNPSYGDVQCFGRTGNLENMDEDVKLQSVLTWMCSFEHEKISIEISIEKVCSSY